VGSIKDGTNFSLLTTIPASNITESPKQVLKLYATMLVFTILHFLLTLTLVTANIGHHDPVPSEACGKAWLFARKRKQLRLPGQRQRLSPGRGLV
jgi:hypothetical protein